MREEDKWNLPVQTTVSAWGNPIWQYKTLDAQEVDLKI